ncbi:MAG: DUF2442 domain-containing protein [Anaerolineae bacterium]|nr:DUF2442 domain-containing protein [Thermoflexales bacterium]HQW36768.1 DUF2442 domain-containing protein [Thermoflexales bacterium]
MVYVRSVKHLDGFRVKLEFSDGTRKEVNLEPFLRGPIFEPMRASQEVFRRVRVDEEIGTIAWDNGADIDPEVLRGLHTPAWMSEVDM